MSATSPEPVPGTGKFFREREPRRHEQVTIPLQHWQQVRSLISAILDTESLVKPL